MKRCKGINRAKHIKGCGNPCTPYKFGLCSKCYGNWIYSNDEAAKAEREKFTIKAKSKTVAENKRSVINFEGKLQEKVQEIVRLIDLGWECLATGLMSTAYDGGHVWGKGAHRECRYNLHNIFAQSSNSNRSTQDDVLMINGVERVFGSEYRAYVESLANKAIVKHSKEEYEQMYRRACKIANALKRDGKKHTLSERIELRNKFNNKIGVYEPNNFIL